MNEINNINLKELQEIVSELLKEGKTEISVKDLEEIYINKQTHKEQNKSTEKYIDVKKRVRKKIDNATGICIRNGLSREIYSNFTEEFIKIVTNKKTNKIGKIIELQEIEINVDKVNQDLEKIDKIINDIKQKIIEINNIYQHNKTNITIYKKNELPDLRNELNLIISPSSNNIDTSIILTKIKNLSTKLDNILLTFNNLSELSQYKTENYSSYNIIEYNINGIIIKVNINDKTYEISSNKKIIEILKECKINKLLKLLERKIQNVKFSDIIEPKYVIESKLSNYLKKEQIPLEDVLRFDINNLLKHLSLDTNFKKIPTLEELSGHNEKLKLFFDTIKILNSQGFETYIGKEENIFEDIIRIYQGIKFDKIENIYELISPIIYNRYPDQIFVYSSLQNVYNCINPEYRKIVHHELSNKTKEESKILKQTIEFLKKYSRNKEGKQYSEDEIINFLNQKQLIVTTKYYGDIESFKEYQNLSAKDDENVINKLTRNHY